MVYDMIIPLGMAGGLQLTMIDVELVLAAITSSGADGAVERWKKTSTRG